MDAKAIIEVLSNPNKTNFIISSIVDDCRQLASRIPQTRFNHCYREANRCADVLAKTGSQQTSDFILSDNPPVDLQTFVDFDCSGLYLNRRYPETIVL